MWKKHLVVLLVLSLVSMVGIYPLQAASLSFDKLPRMERFIFGEEYPDSPLKTRLDKMEEALLGKARSGDSLLTRYRDLTEIVFSDGQGPGLFITANIVEWSLQGKITERALSERVSDIERAVLGEQQEGSVLNRLEDLMTLTFPAGELELGQGTLPPSTLIQVRLLEPIDSGKNKVGDEIDFELAQDVVIDGKLLIPAGTKSKIILKKVKEEERLGQNAEVKMVFAPVETIDGTQEIKLILDKKSREWNDNMTYAAGASILGTVVLGPIGLLAGFLVKGDPVNMPVGTEFYLETPPEAYQITGLVLSTMEP